MIDIQLFVERQSARLVRREENAKPDLEAFPTRMEQCFSLSVSPHAKLVDIRQEIGAQLDLPSAYSFLHPENGIPVSRAQEANPQSALRIRDYWGSNGYIVIRMEGS